MAPLSALAAVRECIDDTLGAHQVGMAYSEHTTSAIRALGPVRATVLSGSCHRRVSIMADVRFLVQSI